MSLVKRYLVSDGRGLLLSNKTHTKPKSSARSRSVHITYLLREYKCHATLRVEYVQLGRLIPVHRLKIVPVHAPRKHEYQNH